MNSPSAVLFLALSAAVLADEVITVTQSWNYPGFSETKSISGVNNIECPSPNYQCVGWSNSSGASGPEDGVWAYRQMGATWSQYTYPIFMSQFGFEIPDDVIIYGIETECLMKQKKDGGCEYFV